VNFFERKIDLQREILSDQDGRPEAEIGVERPKSPDKSTRALVRRIASTTFASSTKKRTTEVV